MSEPNVNNCSKQVQVLLGLQAIVRNKSHLLFLLHTSEVDRWDFTTQFKLVTDRLLNADQTKCIEQL